MLSVHSLTKRDAEGRLVTQCRRLEDPSAPGVVGFLVRKALAMLSENAMGMIEPNSFEKASSALDASIVATSKRQKARALDWGADPVRKDTTAGSAATDGNSNGGTAPAADAVWVNDPDEQEVVQRDLEMVEIARIASDSQDMPPTAAEMATVLRLAGEMSDEQDFLASSYSGPTLSATRKGALVRAYKTFRKDRTFAKSFGAGDSSFAGETSNSGAGAVPVTPVPVAVATGSTIPVASVRAPHSPSAADTLGRVATSPTSPAGPAPATPSTPADLGTGVTVDINVLAVVDAIAAQGYSVSVDAISKALKTKGVVTTRRKS